MSVYEKRASAPWSVLANSWQYTTIYDVMGDPICRLDLEDWGVTEDNQAQLEMEQARVAALIAAAPDMLALLKEAADFIQPFNRAESLLDRIEAAIAKAVSP